MTQCLQRGQGPLFSRTLVSAVGMSELGQSLQDVSPQVAGEVRFGPKTDLIPKPNPVAHASRPL